MLHICNFKCEARRKQEYQAGKSHTIRIRKPASFSAIVQFTAFTITGCCFLKINDGRLKFTLRFFSSFR